jgi:4-amino-4-deoxy-L-arabinose transferase-like glycosyltransferase
MVLVTRLATLGLYPLTDTTEARYAEMARKMLDSGNWLTPMFDVGVPFWGKPPLSFWLSALPMSMGGVGEFTVRLGPLIAGLFVMTLLWTWPQNGPSATQKAIASNRFAVCGSIVFLSTPLGFIATGAVMTDMAMAAGTTLSMIAFWRAWTAPSERLWGWLFFVGQAIGLLAKGPVAAVLTGVALTLFVLTGLRRDGLKRAVLHAWDCVPWLGGLVLTAVLVLPWYVLAEQLRRAFWSTLSLASTGAALHKVAGKVIFTALPTHNPKAHLAFCAAVHPALGPVGLGLEDSQTCWLARCFRG